MAFDKDGLVSFGNVFGSNKVWAYHTADDLATTVASGYFNTVTARLTKADIILAVVATGGTPILRPLVVTSATGAATVTVAKDDVV